MKKLKKDHLQIRIFETRKEMGQVAAEDLANKMRELFKTRDSIRMIFASAPSQRDFFAHLTTIEGLEFTRVTAFHMDEYIGLDADAPQGFGNFLRDHLFSKLSFGTIHYIDSQAADAEAECERYAALLKEAPIDIVCMGIGENAHIAFNDPPVADFNDPKLVKVVELDDICRRQQVNDGCFATLDDVPVSAVTLTIPALMGAETKFCMVPAPTKANAVYHSLENKVSTEYPASILRTKPGTILYLDSDSSSRIGEVSGLLEVD